MFYLCENVYICTMHILTHKCKTGEKLQRMNWSTVSAVHKNLMNRRCLYHSDEEIFLYDLFIQSSCYNPEIKYSCFLVYPSFKCFSLGWSRFIKLEYHSLIKSHYILEPSSCKHIINLAIHPPPPTYDYDCQ